MKLSEAETERMQQAIKLVEKGLTYQEAARNTNLAPTTVRTYCIKAGVYSRFSRKTIIKREKPHLKPEERLWPPSGREAWWDD